MENFIGSPCEKRRKGMTYCVKEAMASASATVSFTFKKGLNKIIDLDSI